MMSAQIRAHAGMAREQRGERIAIADEIILVPARKRVRLPGTVEEMMAELHDVLFLRLVQLVREITHHRRRHVAARGYDERGVDADDAHVTDRTRERETVALDSMTCDRMRELILRDLSAERRFRFV